MINGVQKYCDEVYSTMGFNQMFALKIILNCMAGDAYISGDGYLASASDLAPIGNHSLLPPF